MSKAYRIIYIKITSYNELTAEQKTRAYYALEKHLYNELITRAEYLQLQELVKNIKNK